MTHTKGPWFVVLVPWDDSACQVVSKSEDPHQGELICVTDENRWGEYSPEDIERWEANARLIAAAPELLEACKEALEFTQDEYYVKRITSLTRKLQITIDKAEGK